MLPRYLREERGKLLSRLDGLSERDVRWPGTPTGTHLLGLVEHVAGVELGHLGDVFDRTPAAWAAHRRRPAAVAETAAGTS